MKRRVLVIFILLLCCACVTRAEEPTTQPVEKIQTWVTQLADSDANVREQARYNLLGLTRDDLSQLRTVIIHNIPLKPSQQGVIREVVTHVYLSGESYDPDPNLPGVGFLGIIHNTTDSSSVDIGLSVDEILPGFCGYRVLQRGDMIVHVATEPDVTIHDVPQLRSTLENEAGKTIGLVVLRRGQMVHLEITPDVRPAGIEDISKDKMKNDRMAKAHEYYQTVFAPIMKDSVSQAE
jgi:hypothetical protein